MIYNLTINNAISQPVSGATVVITNITGSTVEFSGTTNSTGSTSCTLTNSTNFEIVVSKGRFYSKYYLTTGTVTINSTYNIGTLLGFVGVSQRTQNSVKLKFIGAQQLTNKPVNLKFYGALANPTTSIITLQLL